jgi:hypothetical protein
MPAGLIDEKGRVCARRDLSSDYELLAWRAQFQPKMTQPPQFRLK